jgi:hypothetical protein
MGGLNIFDFINAIIGILSALAPLVQVPIAIQADKRRSQPNTSLHMMHRQTRRR